MIDLEMNDAVAKVYKKIADNLSDKEIEFCKKLLEKTIENVSNIIYYYVDIHKKIYTTNEIYQKFINNVFKDSREYNKLLNSGESRKYLNKMQNSRSLGLFGLTRKILRVDNKSAEKRIIDYINNVEIVLDCFNDSIETETNFVVYFLTVLYLKEIVLNSFKDYLETIKF